MTTPTIRTYKLRKGRVSQGQQIAIDTHGSEYLITAGDQIINLGGKAFVVEIGFGMGTATWKLALSQPDVNVLAIDLHTPGVGMLIRELAENDVHNVRIIEGDAVEILKQNIAPNSLDAVRLFFPDPWPKSRHHKRRFIVPANLELVASRLKGGGALHLATDWFEYAESAIENLHASGQWKIVESHELCSAQERPLTKFEQRGIDAGRVITDVIAIKI